MIKFGIKMSVEVAANYKLAVEVKTRIFQDTSNSVKEKTL